MSDLGTILAIDGLDVLFIGPYDLSTSLGVAGQFDPPKVRGAITEIVDTAGKSGVGVGIWVPDAPSAKFWVEHGVRFITVSNNELMLFGASSALRRAVEG
jgi:4-hydroxy-2-oxoheptanedioate aldolase